MQTFENSVVKREVQRLLFSNIKSSKVLGLAGPSPEKYLEVLSKYSSKCILCDYNPVNKSIFKGSLIEAFEKFNEVDWVDADFCSSIVTNAVDLFYLFNKMKMQKKSFTLSFTLSQHSGQKQEELLNKLSEIFCISIPELTPIEIRQYPGTRKYIHIYKSIGNLQLIGYRDSGDNMLTGCFTYNSVEPKIEKKPTKRGGKHEAIPAATRFETWKAFVEKNNRLPMHSKDDRDERLLYSWTFNLMRSKVHKEIIAEVKAIAAKFGYTYK